jgi:hypothetical protein
MEVCLLALADGVVEDCTAPRIPPLVFEKWYNNYFDVS